MKYFLSTIVFILFFGICQGQLGYTKKVLNEKYGNDFSLSMSCIDSSKNIYQFVSVADSIIEKPFKAFIIKYDSLGRAVNRKFMDVGGRGFKIESVQYINHDIFVALVLDSLLINSIGFVNDGLVVQLNQDLSLVNSKRIDINPEGGINKISSLTATSDSTFLLSGSYGLPSNGIQNEFLIALDSNLNQLSTKKINDSATFSTAYKQGGVNHWFMRDRYYKLNDNFDIIEERIGDYENPPLFIQNSGSNINMALPATDSTFNRGKIDLVKFSYDLNQQIIILSDTVNSLKLVDKNYPIYYSIFRKDIDTIRTNIYTVVNDSGYTLIQNISSTDTLQSGVFINGVFDNNLLYTQDRQDSGIYIGFGADTTNPNNCFDISFPPDTFYFDTINRYQFPIPLNQQQFYDITDDVSNSFPYTTNIIDSLNATRDTILPAFELFCENKACGVFDPPNGGLICNRGNEITLTVELENPFGIDEDQLITRIIWNDVLEQFSYRAVGGQTIKVFGENEFCEQTSFINIEFDSIRAREVVVGDICLDEPSEANFRVEGLFESISWQNPDFDDNVFQRVFLPGIFPYTVTSLKGCFINGTVVVPEKCPPKIFIPNAFTPNSDGINENFVGYADFTDEFLFRIYDRWGNVIFSTSTSPIVWDGYYKGRLVQLGVYNWRLTYNSVFKGLVYTEDLFGHITAVR